jgi:hypothetical protein
MAGKALAAIKHYKKACHSIEKEYVEILWVEEF